MGRKKKAQRHFNCLYGKDDEDEDEERVLGIAPSLCNGGGATSAGGNEQNVVTVKPVDGFVQVYNGEFVIVQEDNSSERTFCEPFYLVGWNSWDVTRVPRLLNSVGQQFLTQQLETAASSGLNVIRAWAHTVDPDYPVMKGPGEYDEFGLRAPDFLLDEASKVGIRVILSFVDNWKYPVRYSMMINFRV